jgi:UDP-N-acetylmuramate: L-alanyl-gamma-D-glutamyl-meso-diaminopimelate ligase
MGALAGLLKASGHEVRGSDGPLYPPMSTQLARAEIPVYEGYAASNLEWGPTCVVVGNVCRPDHPEVIEARARGLRIESFPSMLASTLLEQRRSLVVAGTHGKTTTSSLLTWMLRTCGRDPSWLIGGVPQNLGRGFHLGGGEAIVLEGDEYNTAFFDQRSKFLHYRPQRAILTSVEYDHADIFDSYEAVRDAFIEFVRLIPEAGLLVVDRGNLGAMEVAAAARCEVLTYKVFHRNEVVDPSVATYVVKICSRPGVRRVQFEIFERGLSLGEFSTLLSGAYNLGNITAAFAVAQAEGCELEQLREAIRMFRGVKRRQELLGVVAGVRVIQDFAHHPTAVELTIKGTRRRYGEHSLHVCFEPRSSSSRRDVFFEGYRRAFDAATRVHIAPVYMPEKVPDGRVLDVHALAAALRERGVDASSYTSIPDVAKGVLDEAASGDTVLLLSSGSFGGLADRLLESLGDAVVFASPEDAPTIDELLVACGMPRLQDAEQIESLAIRPSRERREAAGGTLPAVIGCVHLQLAGDSAFLFGLAVAPVCRGEGLGWVLADAIMRRARTLGARYVHLIAGETAEFFTDKLGFSEVDPNALDARVRALSNFVATYRPGALCMTFELPREG